MSQFGPAAMNSKSHPWLRIPNTPECGKQSGDIVKTLSESERNDIMTVMGHRRQDSKDCFYLMDTDVVRKVFAGFFQATDRTF